LRASKGLGWLAGATRWHVTCPSPPAGAVSGGAWAYLTLAWLQQEHDPVGRSGSYSCAAL